MAWVCASHPFLPSTLTWGGASSGCNLTPVLQVLPLVVWWWGTRRPKTFRSTECLHGQLDLSLKSLWAGLLYAAVTFVCSCLYECIHSWHNTHTLVPFLASLPDSLPQLCKQLQLSLLIDSRLFPHPSTLSETPPPPPHCCHCCPSSYPFLRAFWVSVLTICAFILILNAAFWPSPGVILMY